MSRFDLRDVSERLTKSRSVESVISEFLRSLHSMRSDWYSTLAFYEVSQDALVDVYELDQNRLVRRNIVVPVESLPHTLVRKVFHSTMPIQQNGRETVFSPGGATAHYTPSRSEASDLMALTVLTEWESCICMPLAYQDDLIAILVISSAKKNAFAGKALGELIPLKSIATVALAQNLYRTHRKPPQPREAAPEPIAGPPSSEVDERSQQSAQLDRESQDRTAQIEALLGQIETLDRSSSSYKEELERVKVAVSAMEESSESAVEILTETYQQLQTTQWTLEELQATVDTMKEVFQLLSEEVSRDFLPEVMVEWFCAHQEVARCSLLVPDEAGSTLQVAAHRGIDPSVAGRVRVRVGQGVAGWVAAHRKPLYVRVSEDAKSLGRSPDGTYNSDSFIVVPLVHNGQMHGVLSLSNRTDGQGFTQGDLDRTMLAASAFAVAFGGQQLARQAATWA
ncbi:MAG TPA: GAF domain-containing protein [Candidatus Eisenbacteria bacterium]|nr:GAF domain-containing protein [Candidatus Eisenbacteria bacterium]